MLISNIFSRKVYPITVIMFVILEFVFLLFISIFFYISLNSNKEYLERSIIDNDREIQNSFNSFLTRRISMAKQDLFLIGKHNDIFWNEVKMKINKDFYKNLENCIVKSSEIKKSSFTEEYNKISDHENSMMSIIFNYLNESNSSEEMIKELKKNKILNQISLFGQNETIDNENYVIYIKYMKSIFKSIFIKEGVSNGKYLSLNNIYLFIDEYVLKYLPTEISHEKLKKLPIYNTNENICRFKYRSSCVTEFIKKSIYSRNEKYDNLKYVEYFHIFDTKFNLFSCINFKDKSNAAMNNNFLCLEHNIKYLLQYQFNFKNLKGMDINGNIINLFSLKNENNKLLLIYSLGNNVNEFFNVYKKYFSDFSDILKDYIFSEESPNIELFHLIYFHLFKFKKSQITEDLIKDLIEEYTIIKKEIIKSFDELESLVINQKNDNEIEKIVKLSQHFLFSTYNKSGLIDKENGIIERGDFIYIIKPLIDKNIYYSEKNYTKINFSSFDSNYSGIEAKILGFNIILSQNTLNIWNFRIFLQTIFTMLKWLFYFTLLIIFLITLINVVFTKVLDNIFNPILLLYQRLSIKFMSSKIVFEETNLNKKQINLNNNNQKEKDSLTSEIISLTPEMEELIQLCKFLENISYMKELMLSNEQMELDFDLMNEMYNVLSNRLDMIKYGHFVSSFYFKKKKYIECNNSIKLIENILETEEDRFKEENENIEIEVINAISNKYYINEFQSSKEVFENKTSLSQLNYYELIIIREKLYFYLGICNLFLIVELKNKVKELKKDYELQNKKNYYHNLRGRALTNRRTQPKPNANSKVFENSFGRETIRMKLNSQAKAMEILENQILTKTEIAIKYFKLSYDINNKYCINKIKCIIILLYIAKCQLFNEKNKSEAIDTMKNSIIKLYTLNQDFRKTNDMCKFNPIIMLLINGAIMEQILYLIVKINNKTNNKLTIELLSDIMKLSYFKTDDIQSKAAKNITYLIKKVSQNLKIQNKKGNKTKSYTNKINFFEKMSFRLSPNIFSLQNKDPDIIKNIFILFSPNLIKVLPSSIELSEILSKCVRNYMSPNDRIQCLRFDMNYNPDNFKTPAEFNKDFITRILQDNEKLKKNKYRMENCILSIVQDFNIINNKRKDDINIDKDILFNDNYIFQFILSKDYTFDSHNNKKIIDELKTNNISLFTFVFDGELKDNNTKENNKINEIIKYQKKIPEGVLIFVDNFLNIKMVFQNISRKYKPKNIFRINSKSYKNIYIDYH